MMRKNVVEIGKDKNIIVQGFPRVPIRQLYLLSPPEIYFMIKDASLHKNQFGIGSLGKLRKLFKVGF